MPTQEDMSCLGFFGLKRSMWGVLGVIFSYNFCRFMLRPVYPALITAFVLANNADLSAEELNTKSTEWNIYLTLMEGFPAIVVVAIYGGVSDRYGRKLTIAVHCLAAAAADFSFSLFVSSTSSVAYLFIPYFLAGLAGHGATLLMLVLAYAADKTDDPDVRFLQFGYVLAARYLGSFLGPLVGGVFYDNVGHWIPFTVAGLLLIVLATAVVIYLPESLPKDRQTDVIQISDVSVFHRIKLFTRNKSYGLLAIIFLLTAYLIADSRDVFLYFSMLVFKWSVTQGSVFVAMQNLFKSLTVALFGPFVTWYLKGREYWNLMFITRLGLLAFMISFILYAIAPEDWMYYFIAPFVYSFGAIADVSIRNIFSTSVGPLQQGTMLSGVAAIQLLQHILVSPIVYTVYSQTNQSYPETAFWFIAFLMLVAVGMSFRISKNDFHLASPTPLLDFGDKQEMVENEKLGEKIRGDGGEFLLAPLPPAPPATLDVLEAPSLTPDLELKNKPKPPTSLRKITRVESDLVQVDLHEDDAVSESGSGSGTSESEEGDTHSEESDK